MKGHVRPAKLQDLNALEALERTFPGDRLSRRQWRYLLNRGHCEILVCEQAGKIAGNAVLLYRKRSRWARLYSLVVHPQERQKGLGRALMRAAEEAAFRQGCVGMSLEVRLDNARAIEIYEKNGYQRVCELEDYYEDHARGLRMRKRLRGGSN